MKDEEALRLLIKMAKRVHIIGDLTIALGEPPWSSKLYLELIEERDRVIAQAESILARGYTPAYDAEF